MGPNRVHHDIGAGSVIAELGGTSLESLMSLSALAGAEPVRAVSGLTEANVALARSGLVTPSGNPQRRAERRA